MNPREIENCRREIYRTARALRIRSMPEATRWLDRVGFAWLFATTRAPELPSLYEAVKGRRGVEINDWDHDAETIWVWKNDLPAQKRAYYGKALCGRPTLISLKMLPYVYACAGNASADFARVYALGGVSHDAKKIHAALVHGGPMPTVALRRAAALDSSDGQRRYHRALDELQRQLYILPIGATNEVGQWPSQIFELVARWFPKSVAAARNIEPRAARQTLVKKYLQTVVAAQPSSVARIFGFTREQWEQTREDLLAARAVKFQDEWMFAKK